MKTSNFFSQVMSSIGKFFIKMWNGILNLRKKRGFNSILASLFSIVIGIVIGLLLMLIIKPKDAFYGLAMMLSGGVSNISNIFQVLYTAAPLLMTGLAVGFAFKTGLFNIGAAGQYTVGAFFAIFGAVILKLPWYLDILLAALGGALWGAIPGLFKAFLNVNEVITSIMFNWIGLFAVDLIIANTPRLLDTYYGGADQSRAVNVAGVNPGAKLPSLGMESLSPYMNVGIFIAIILAIVMFIILNKTTFGYELKACGYNKESSKYAGINAKRNIVLSMAISGALAGIGGALTYLAGTAQMQVTKSISPIGFNGIPVALLGMSNPIGIIFSALFIAYIQIGGNAMQPEFATEVIDIVISVIIYLSAFSLVFKQAIDKYLLNRNRKQKDLELAEENKPKAPAVETPKEGDLQ
jgi:simple sugar transport system permease protein